MIIEANKRRPKGRTGFLVGLFSFAAAILWPIPAQSHHGCNTPGAFWGQNLSLLRLDAQQKTFGTHRAMTLVPSISYAPVKWLGLGATLPFSQVVVDQTGATRSGLGDLELNVQGTALRLWDDSLVVLLGTEMEIPVGDDISTLSSGHYALIPHVTLAYRPSARWLLAASVQHTHGFKDEEAHDHDHHHDHGTVGSGAELSINPHSDRELKFALGGSYLGELGYVTLVGEAYQPLEGSAVFGPMQIKVETGINLTEDVTVNWQYTVPFAGALRESWTATAGIIWRWADFDGERALNSAIRTPTKDCDCPEDHPKKAACSCPEHPVDEPACNSCNRPETNGEAAKAQPLDTPVEEPPCAECDKAAASKVEEP